MLRPLVALLLALLLAGPSAAVKRHDFKTCGQSGFCRRLRALADRSPAYSPYFVPTQLTYTPNELHLDVRNKAYPDVSFEIKVEWRGEGVVRVRLDEVNGLRQRYNETAMWTLLPDAPAAVAMAALDGFHLSEEDRVVSAKWKGGEVKIELEPLKVTFFRNGAAQIVLNDRNLLHMEHFRLRSLNRKDGLEMQEQGADTGSEAEWANFYPSEDDEKGMWDEQFGGKMDSKVKGPEALSLDITFPGYSHVYGIPQHASSLSLKTTRGGEDAYTDPYRLYNLDVFEYEADSEMSIYGSIPFMQAHRAGSTVGVLVLSGSEMWIDITKSATPRSYLSSFRHLPSGSRGTDKGPSDQTTSTHWMAESGVLDLFVFLGPTTEEIMLQYAQLTGFTALPPLFSMGYHQCRWNYLSTKDVLTVQSRFEEADIPLDVMWLDIEYADEHMYFIWNDKMFPDPLVMQEGLAAKGRKLVAIVDPHVKKTDKLYVYTEAKERDILCKAPDGTEFEGHCWTGNSVWVDWFNPGSWAWWASLFRFDKFKGSTKNLFIWNDMNEPSIFNGPEITMQKDALHYGGWEHRDVHNINGMIYQNVTARGLIERSDPPMRPFVLTRAFFAGSQRFGAMWTGDNLATWPHLKGTPAMLLNNGIAGMTFGGADVGGFFGDPAPEFFVRFYQLGVFSPFFRAHGHIDTKRREPFLFEQPYQGYMRDSIRLRQTLMPMLYTAMEESTRTGVPVLRPQYLVFPDDDAGFALDDQFYVGSSGLLVKPVLVEGETKTEVYIADSQPYYHYLTHDIYFGNVAKGTDVLVPAELGSTPILLQGGHIVPRRDLVRRATILAWKDPISLFIGVDLLGTGAKGDLYLDDGESYDFQKGEFVRRHFTLEPTAAGKKKPLRLSSTGPPATNAYAAKLDGAKVSEITILGLPHKPLCVRADGATEGLDFTWTAGLNALSERRRGGPGSLSRHASKLVIRDADASVIADWSLLIDFESPCSVAPFVDTEKALESPECAAGYFYCRNEGHLPQCVRRSLVNDGICEPECCDGSDETDGKADCPNTCQTIGAEYRKKKAESDRQWRMGSAVRKTYISHGEKEQKKLQADIEKNGKRIAELEEKEAVLKAALERAENAEEGEIQRKKDSVLYQKLVDMQAVIKMLKTQRANLEGHVEDLSSILAGLSRDFNPNYQDMAVLGATRAFTDWKKANGQEDDGGDPPVPLGPGDEYHEREIQALIDEDPLSLIDGLSLRVGKPAFARANLFNIQQYLPKEWLPVYHEYRKTLVELLERTGILTAAAPFDGEERPELAKARAAHSAVADDLTKARNDLGSSKADLEKDFGPDWEWKKLEGTCVEKEIGEYTYSVCFFGEAHQKASNGMKTSLGRFKEWSKTLEPGTQDYYKEQMYADGQRCWNGPLRSAKVILSCAPQNALLSVVEPQKCEYDFIVTTPAVCYPLEEDPVPKKDEL